LHLDHLRKSFGSFEAVTGLDLKIAEGEFFTIVGPSGSGKTTLLRMLAGLESPTSGKILLRGQAHQRLMPAGGAADLHGLSVARPFSPYERRAEHRICAEDEGR
jgi:ABC-type nitrate/sulfonate/bicarbonate transport system ATPase subunit